MMNRTRVLRIFVLALSVTAVTALVIIAIQLTSLRHNADLADQQRQAELQQQKAQEANTQKLIDQEFGPKSGVKSWNDL